MLEQVSHLIGPSFVFPPIFLATSLMLRDDDGITKLPQLKHTALSHATRNEMNNGFLTG